MLVQDLRVGSDWDVMGASMALVFSQNDCQWQGETTHLGARMDKAKLCPKRVKERSGDKQSKYLQTIDDSWYSLCICKGHRSAKVWCSDSDKTSPIE